METRITGMTTSQVRCFKQCRRRYYLEYVRNLKPVETPKALEIGTLYHAGIERILSGLSLQIVMDELVEMQIRNTEQKGIDYDPMNVFVACEMVRAFDRESNWREWRIVAVEKTFEVTTGYAKRLRGKFDGIILHPETGRAYLIEHKSTSQWGTDGSGYLDKLELDEQSTNYLYAYNRMLEDGVIDGGEVDGIFYDIIEKPTIKPFTAKPIDQRKYTKDGALYKSQHDRDETPEEFRARVRAWYEEKPRVHTKFIYRTPAQIAAAVEDFNLTLRDCVTAEREGTFYRTPSACSILPCPYRAKCLIDAPDTDCLFVTKTAKNEELSDSSNKSDN